MRMIGPAAASGFVAGVALSYWLDPVAGRRRRARAVVRGVRAVKRIGIDVHEKPRIPAPHGGWPPSTRLLVTGSGVGLALAALRYPSPIALFGAAIGLAAAARGTANRAIGELATMSAR